MNAGSWGSTFNMKRETAAQSFFRSLENIKPPGTYTVRPVLNGNSKISGLDKGLDQWVFHPLLFSLLSILLHI